MPQVSIIVPCYNTAATLGDTLASLQSQTCPDWEAICVDAGSKDETADVLSVWSKRDGRIKGVRIGDVSLAATRNRGVPEARAPYVLFLDSDDVARSDAVQTLLSAARRQDGEVIVAGGYEWISATGEPLSIFRFPSVRSFTVDEFLIADRISSMALVSTSLMKRYPFDESLKGCEDWDLWLRLADAGANLVTIPRIVFGYRIRASSLGHKADVMYHSGRRVLERWLARASDRQAVRDALHRWAFACGMLAYASGDPDAICQYFIGLSEFVPSNGFYPSAAEAVRWALLFTAGGAPFGPGHAETRESVNRIREWLGRGPLADHAGQIAEQLVATSADSRISLQRVREAISRQPAIRRVVIYGLGTNGLTLLEQLRTCPEVSHVELSVADDYANEVTFEAIALPRVNPRGWKNWPEGSLVVVTPNDCLNMCQGLIERGGRPEVDFMTLAGPGRQDAASGHSIVFETPGHA